MVLPRLDRGAPGTIYQAMSKFSPLAAFGQFAAGRLFLFRKEVGTLFRAFFHPATPFPLKAAMLFVVFYLVSPFDLIPDFIPFAGWMDDLVLVPLAVSFIVSLLPLEVTAKKVPVTVPARRR
ncbi:hypothetical protein GCM10011321_36900 [Youhaiella tibetensis]|nr:DUF1232 domain-containing protein [Youhaiella tibetensis]GGF42931.1 hypothetical protein GCM10011321_36900 [Youhaiella tibetensis]